MTFTSIPEKLSSFIKDIDKSFWNGDASLKIKFEDFVRKLSGDPTMTLATLKQDPTIKANGILFSEVSFQLDTDFKLGEKHHPGLCLLR